MRWLTIVVAVIALTGCSDSHDATAPDTSTNETTVAGAPNAYTRVMAQLPPFDEPASPEVTAYRRATIGARAARCAESRGADRAVFVRANAKVLELAGTVRRARLLSERAAGHRDGNGCPEDSGPRTYFTTTRTYGLPAGTGASAVFAHYEGVLHYGWLETSGTRDCERTFAQGAAYLSVDACTARRLRLTALGRTPMLIPAAERPPPRPFGLKYPAAADQSTSTEAPSYEVESGETCERGTSLDVPSIILPPPPGVRAELRGARIVVEWSFERILGDCPPTEIILSFASASSGKPAYVTRVAVRGHSGTAAISVPDAVRRASVLRAATESVDGTRSRTVAILIRRRT